MITRRSLVGMAACTVSAAAFGAAPEKGAEKSDKADKADKKVLSDHDQIAARIQSFVKAYNDSDLQKLMGHYAEDLVKSRQGGVTESKKDAAARIFLVFQNFTGEISVSTEEIVVSGDMAYTRGAYKAVLAPRQGGAKDQTIERRFLEIWRKENDQWLICRSLDNAVPKGRPAPALTPEASS